MPEINNQNRPRWSNFSLLKVFVLVFEFFGLKLLVGLVAAALAIFLFGWLAEDVFEGATIAFDATVRAAVHEAATPILTGLMKIVTVLGSTIFLTVATISGAAAFYYFEHKRGFALLLLTMIGNTILLFSLKTGFKRARPEPFFDYALPASYSFPSGHSLSSFCFYGILAALLTARTENRALKIFVWALAAALVLLIGLSRVYLGVHYPSDVLAGYAVGLIWVVTVALGDFFLKRRNAEQVKSDN